MSFFSIPSVLIQVGKAIRKEIFQYTKDNFDDHETRLNLVESAIGKQIIFSDIVRNPASYFVTSDGRFAMFRSPIQFLITTAIITNIKDGTSGILSVDVLKGSNIGTLTSIFSVLPSIASGAGDGAVSTNAIISAGLVSVGDYIAIDISSIMSGQIKSDFQFQIYGDI